MSEPAPAIEIFTIVYIFVTLELFTSERHLHSETLHLLEEIIIAGMGHTTQFSNVTIFLLT